VKEARTIDILGTMEKFRAGFNLLNYMTPLSIFKLNPDVIPFLFGNVVSTDIPESSVAIYESFFGKTYQGKDKWYYDTLMAIMNYSDPKLLIIHDTKAHDPFRYDEYGKSIKRKEKEYTDPHNYPPQHYFTAKIVISYIDYILNKDSDAVIVLQSDHGLHHGDVRRQLLSKYGKSDEDVRLMQNQTISAVRIPEKFGVIDQPIEPLNITRFLVNQYVGGNYTLLSPDEIVR
jgi:hypothetical protein